MSLNGVAAPMSEATLADVQDDVMKNPAEPGDMGSTDEIDEDLEDAAADLELQDASSEGKDDTDLSEADVQDEDEADLRGAPLSPSAIPAIGGDGSTKSVPSFSLTDETHKNDNSLDPTRPTPYVHDAGHLLIVDPNPVPQSSSNNAASEAALTSNARDAAQSLLNHLLTTCPITSSKTATSGSGVNMTLPTPNFVLPREKRVPTPKAPTKWEKFAAKKGIGKNQRKGQAGEDRAGKKVYDETSGEWIPKYGYRGKNKQGENDWLVEIDEKAEKKKAQANEAGKDPRNVNREERRDRIKRNERKMRANERKGGKAN